MPSGRTHDRITLWCLPAVTGLTYGQTRSSHLTLIVAGCFLFSGLMFGPDLDIHRSYHFQRWGWLRWLWLPYQKSVRHRSFLSHGPIIGTAVRILYLTVWAAILAVPVVLVAPSVWEVQWSLSEVARMILRSLSLHSKEWLAIFLGLELGAMGHYLSDWTGSAYKRIQTQGLGKLLSNSGNKRPKTPKIFGFFSSKSTPKRRRSSSTRRPTSASNSKRNTAKKTKN
ncbi:MAG: metal-binding protein [Lyngbya sp.]|nr:metal-binding protein [Lyngbya sp.]